MRAYSLIEMGIQLLSIVLGFGVGYMMAYKHKTRRKTSRVEDTTVTKFIEGK